MAARLNPKHDQATRDKIQTSQLVNRLQKYALFDPSDTEDKPPVMSDGQIKAALGLLRKTLPDLSNVEMTGAEGGPLVVEVVRFSGEKA